MRFDVITKTLPTAPAEKLAVLLARWGREDVDGAAAAVGMSDGEIWSAPRVQQVADHLQTLAATKQDSAMLARDEPKAAPEPVDEDPLAAVRDAIDELIGFASDDAINAGSFNPSLQGPNEPNVAGMRRHIEGVLDEVRKLMGEVVLPDCLKPPAPAPDNGLLTSHNPDKRGAM